MIRFLGEGRCNVFEEVARFVGMRLPLGESGDVWERSVLQDSKQARQGEAR